MIKKMKSFEGRHWETGSIQNALALQGVKASHTNKPYSEAFLLGISGGITFGYFTFEYKGFLPHLAFLTRNTFSPFQTMLERLGVIQNIHQTTKSEIAEKNLIDVLETGYPALVWADACTLPYNGMAGAQYWNMMPVVAYGMDGDTVLLADRSSQPFRVSMEIFTQARARVKEDRFRLLTIEPPQTSKLVSAVQKSIWQCIELFTEKPPKGTRDNFGFAAYQNLADLLVNTRNKKSWERFFARGPRLYSALAGSVTQPGAFEWIMNWGSADGAERAMYADFLDEAALLLEKPNLKNAAKQFRLSHRLWCDFAHAILPDTSSHFNEVKRLLLHRKELFIQQGEDASEDIQAVNAQLNKLEAKAGQEFFLSENETKSMRENLREHVLKISAAELKAIEMLQAGI